jgi:hypothetical protein
LKKTKSNIFFKTSNKRFHGDLVPFYDTEALSIEDVFRESFIAIKKEIVDFYTQNDSQFGAMYIPGKHTEPNWKVFSFYGFSLKYSDSLKKFPTLAKALSAIPHLVGAQISVLEPHTNIKAHISGSNALIRSHLGVVIPGNYPQLGIRVKTEERGWEEGRVFSFSEANRHYAWNHTNLPRIVLLMDTIHPDFIQFKKYICGASLSVLVLKMFYNKLPITRNMSSFFVDFFHQLFTYLFYFIFFIQDDLKIEIAPFLQQLKFKKSK